MQKFEKNNENSKALADADRKFASMLSLFFGTRRTWSKRSGMLKIKRFE
jgi:hypothetical protein